MYFWEHQQQKQETKTNKQKKDKARQNTENKTLKMMHQNVRNNGQQDIKKQSLKFLQSTALFPGLDKNKKTKPSPLDCYSEE